MSITFWCPEAPTEKVRPYEDEPDYEEERSLLPEVNMNNANAKSFLTLLGVPPDDCGRWETKDLPEIRRKLVELVNRPIARALGLKETEVYPGALRVAHEGNVVILSRGPYVVDFGRDDDYVVRRAQQLLALVSAAQDQGYSVSWG